MLSLRLDDDHLRDSPSATDVKISAAAEPGERLRSSIGGAPGVTRTPGTQFRKLLLYPPELRGHQGLRMVGPDFSTMCNREDVHRRTDVALAARGRVAEGRESLEPKPDTGRIGL